MTSVLRLATLSYAIALVDAGFLFWSDRDAGNWGPAKHTAGLTEIDPVGWTPKPTAPPGAKPLDLDLRRRQQTVMNTCGYPADNISAPAITCSNGEYCHAMEWQSVAGCCSEANRRDCRVPTTCIESTRSQSSRPDSRTLVCDDPARPRCVTYLYDASFFENFNGYSFLACGSDGEAASSAIGTTPPPGWLLTTESAEPSTSELSTTGTGTTNPVTITVFPSTSSSTSATVVAEAGNSRASRTGAIVGGTIGGVAGLALIFAAIFFCLRYRRRRGGGAKEVVGSPPYPSRSYPATNVYPSGLPEPQYNSDFYGELPPQMAQSSTQHMTGYPPPNSYEPRSSYEPRASYDHRTSYEPVAVPREIHHPPRPTTFVPGSPRPNADDIVSPISPGDQLNPADDPATYTWISNPTPPPQSEYSPYSPPPPPQFQSYRPYPGT
ncbi:hypothetical protein F4818DRAFT_128854 [Hypoxylon cercidicola]|nr:hypothetical protein F4818DRAFT_128854 [Hypoxylon cercidicola]